MFRTDASDHAPARPQSLWECIGGTPLLRLARLPGAHEAVLLAKAEFLNPGGSVKSRTALGLLRAAEAEGRLGPGDTIVEASSGNEGIALAMLAASRGLRVRIVMPDDLPSERRRIIEALGGEIVPVAARRTIAETMRACLAAAEAIARETGAFYARQFENEANPRVHEETTAEEILRQVDGPVDAVVAAVGTGGTLMGVARALRRRFPAVRVVAVEPEAAAALSGGPIGTHRQYGIGEGFVPALVDPDLIDEVIRIPDEEAYATAQALARHEGLLVGVTSGTNVAAALKVAKALGPGRRVVTVLPDAAERYFSSPLFPA